MDTITLLQQLPLVLCPGCIAADHPLCGYPAQGSLYVITILLLFELNLIAVCIRREFFHAFSAIFFLVYILAFIAINLRSLG